MKKVVGMVTLALLAGTNRFAKANLLIDPTGGTTIFDSTKAYDDDVSASHSLGFTGHFFGAVETSVDVSVNGNLNFSKFGGYSNTAFPIPQAMIAPLWDDQAIISGSGESITEKSVDGSYFAVTWDVTESGSTNAATAPTYQFQAVWFGAPTTIGNTQFQTDEIVFSYNQVDSTLKGGNATVGLNSGTGTFVGIPSVSNGFLTNVAFLSTGDGDVVAYTLGTDNTYQVSAFNINAVPEPSSALLILSAGILPLCRRRHVNP